MKISLTNNSVSLLFLLIFAGFTLAFPLPAIGITINVASCSRTDMQNAINSALDGDTILVPAGNCTWSSEIIANKDVAIIGAGSANTKIISGGNCFALNLANTTRISGFGFTNCTVSGTGEPAAGKSFRIDHNAFTSTSWQENSFHGSCQNPQRHPTGLVDNNTFYNYRVLVSGSNCMRDEGTYQDQLWSQSPPLGNGTGVVYVEDNTFSGDNNLINWMDGNYAGRYVARFNTITANPSGYFEVHSVQGNNRAVQMWELYKNTATKPNSDWTPFAFIRGGSGMVWGNRLSSNYTNDILLDNVRSQGDPGDGVGSCNGSSNWDGNTSGMFGYPCRDQIGRSMDNSIWSLGQPYAQNLTPAYFWDNIKGASTQMSVVISDACGSPSCLPGNGNNDIHLVANRDWYTTNTSFNGTAGVGEGMLANRPSSCTTGVGYWATDQGEWNSNQAGPDGQLYKCTTPNTWTLYYTPYQYPHPLQGGTPPPPDTTPPSPPSGLIVQ